MVSEMGGGGERRCFACGGMELREALQVHLFKAIGRGA